MGSTKILQTIKYEAELDHDFASLIMNTPGGERLDHCIQCGTCSSTCPMSIYMDHTPRQIMAMIRAGFKDEVLSSITTWLCASCYSCAVDCPKQINITDIMYALKRLSIQEGQYPKQSGLPVLASEFFRLIKSRGRNNEARLILMLYLRTNIFKILGQASVGFRLWLHGRLGLHASKIKNIKQLQNMLAAVEKEGI